MSLDFLKPLEERVDRAAEEIATLRRRGTELEERIAELEQALAAAVAGKRKPAPDREREELRTRVAALVERLEGLLEG